jgi:acyl-coenzyme A thioesterase 13
VSPTYSAPYGDSPGRWKTVSVGDGKVEVTWTPTEDMSNPHGSVHGGIIATVIDEVTGAAVTSAIESFSAPTVSMNVDYLHALPIGGTYTAFGEIVRMGRAMAVADARILDKEGKVLARGTCIYQIPRPK